MMTAPELIYLRALPLRHTGDCHLRGVTPDLRLYVDELYGDQLDWMAQGVLTADGEWLHYEDEDHGRNRAVAPVGLPPDAATPQPGWHSRSLNYTGARHRGLRQPERVSELVRELTLHEKMALAERMGGRVAPSAIIGLAESFVISEAALAYPRWYVVCRRVRVAVALPQVAIADDGTPYDYDTHVLHLAHRYDRDADREPTLSEALAGVGGAALARPLDCLISAGHLFIAEGGHAADQRLSRVHIWRVGVGD